MRRLPCKTTWTMQERTKKIPAGAYRAERTTQYKTGDDWDLDDEEPQKRSKLPLIGGIFAGVVFLAGVITLPVTLFGGGGGKDTTAPANLLGRLFEEVLEDESLGDFQIIEESTGSQRRLCQGPDHGTAPRGQANPSSPTRKST